MTALLIIIHVIVCIALIMIVLLQTGKGADMGAAFGGGSNQTLFGSSGASTFLSKATTAAAIVFMVTSLGLAYISGHTKGGGSSVMDQVEPPLPQTEPTSQSAPASQSESEPATQSASASQPESEPSAQSTQASQPESEPAAQSVPVSQPESEPAAQSTPASQPEPAPTNFEESVDKTSETVDNTMSSSSETAE